MKIIVVDGDLEDTRFKKIRNSFIKNEQCVEVFYLYDEKYLRQYISDCQYSEVGFARDYKFSICLVHESNQELSDEIISDWKLVYSGVQGYLEEMSNWSGEQMNYANWKKIQLSGQIRVPKVWRAMSGENAITQQEASELINFFDNNAEGEIPACLLPNLQISYLPALSILCQGYLAVRFSKIHSNSISVNEALTKMGWTEEFLNSPVGKSCINADESQITKSAEARWWLDCFDEDIQFKEHLQNEWDRLGGTSKNKQKVDCLMKSIHIGSIDEPNIVAEALIAIINVIEYSTLS